MPASRLQTTVNEFIFGVRVVSDVEEKSFTRRAWRGGIMNTDLPVDITASTEVAKSRSNIYALLARVYREEITPEFLTQMREPIFLDTLKELGVTIDTHLSKEVEDSALLEDLAVEYTGLFIGPESFIPPYESVHHERDDGDWGTLWGADTVAVKKFIESSGLEYLERFSSLPDHVSVELEFMQNVTEREYQAWREDDMEGALYCLKMEKLFLENHILKWVPHFCDKVMEKSGAGFYYEMAGLTKKFLEYEKQQIGSCIYRAESIIEKESGDEKK
jgi:TorA maturation chaperone TorD